MAEAAVAPGRRGQCPGQKPRHPADPLHHHLGDPIPPPDDEGLPAVVDQQDPDLRWGFSTRIRLYVAGAHGVGFR